MLSTSAREQPSSSLIRESGSEMESPWLHPLCIYLVDDLSETALASRRYAYASSSSLVSTSSCHHMTASLVNLVDQRVEKEMEAFESQRCSSQRAKSFA